MTDFAAEAYHEAPSAELAVKNGGLMADEETKPAPDTANLGSYINSARRGLDMSLRDVEVATNNEVSNAYLSQLENGKIAKPSPHVLYSLSEALHVSYEGLMERAGYIAPSNKRGDKAKHGKAATFAVDNLTREEEAALLEHLAYLRWRRTSDRTS